MVKNEEDEKNSSNIFALDEVVGEEMRDKEFIKSFLGDVNYLT